MIDRSPLVSVIVSVYNQERYIGRCLRSLLHQTFRPEHYEIIVINDGSTDRTSYALELFHDAIRTITNKTNLGLPASINEGILAATAPYIVRVDSDDYVNANFLTLLYLYLDMNPHFDAAACDYLLVDDEENVLKRVNCIDYPIACGIMFRKDQIIDIGMYDDKFRYREDDDLRIRFNQKYSISRLELPLYRYRQHKNNMTKNAGEMERHYRSLLNKHGSGHIL